MRKVHPKQCDERFVCVECLRSDYAGDPMRYDKESHQANFTSIPLELWKKKNYMTVEDAVMEYLIKKKGK